jgi:tetratricopeptide (TPR) repeat protein
MWSEQGGDAARGAVFYEEALRLLPDYAAAGIHLAELDLARGDEASAQARLTRVVQNADEPEALALLGDIHLRQGRTSLGRGEIARAKQRYEALLARHPQAFADHAAEFYLGAGRDPQRAWTLAQANLRERPTRRAHLLAIRAAEALGKKREAESRGLRLRTGRSR